MKRMHSVVVLALILLLAGVFEAVAASYVVENQWGGSSAPWHPGGVFVLGAREKQLPVAFNLVSSDQGRTLQGTMTYRGEGPIGVRAKQAVGNTYYIENQWGGPSAPWHSGGQFVIGARENQKVVGLTIQSSDQGGTFQGTMTYAGEGPIGIRGTLQK